MGQSATDWDAPVTKTTGGLLVFRRTHPMMLKRSLSVAQQARLAKAICCQCNRCTQLCPRHAMGLPVEPHKAMRAIATGNSVLLGNAAGVLACSGCGLCTHFACEMGLTPSVVMTMLKQELGKAGVKPVPEENIRAEAWITVKEVPVGRLISRMGLSAFDRAAPLSERTVAPRTVTLPLRQHVGRPAEPVVKAGDRVRKGQLIAAIPAGALGAALHASIDGTVRSVDAQNIVIMRELAGG
jgi:Na+-translocating ferredoxin:NAD+ oxidoreductase RnfC subunit